MRTPRISFTGPMNLTELFVAQSNVTQLTGFFITPNLHQCIVHQYFRMAYMAAPWLSIDILPYFSAWGIVNDFAFVVDDDNHFYWSLAEKLAITEGISSNNQRVGLMSEPIRHLWVSVLHEPPIHPCRTDASVDIKIVRLRTPLWDRYGAQWNDCQREYRRWVKQLVICRRATYLRMAAKSYLVQICSGT